MWVLHIIGRILFCRLRIYEFYDPITLPLEVGIKYVAHRHAPECSYTYICVPPD